MAKTGFLVPEKDDQGLAQKIDQLLCDRAAAKVMGFNGREIVCQHFDIQKQTAKLEDLYDQVLSKAG